MTPKLLLVIFLIAGFLFMWPYWQKLSPEQRQDITENNLMHQYLGYTNPLFATGMHSLDSDEQERVRQRIQQRAQLPDKQDPRIVAMSQKIRRYVADDFTARSIARWVQLYSQRFDLPPELILGLILVESRFDHYAISGVGALGLMQIMPFWKNKLGTPQDNLFEIETNIRYGCAILRTYINHYRSVGSALAAYNGSLGSMRYPNKIFAKMKQFETH